MPRLILPNGPPGCGKSTLAQRYVDDHPMALNLDLDRVRAQLGHWQDRLEEAGLAARGIAVVAARVQLLAGHDVVVPQYLGWPTFVEQLAELAAEVGADFVEIALMDGRERAVQRFLDRGTIPAPRVELEETYDRLMALVDARPGTIVVPTVEGEIDQAYRAVLCAASRLDCADAEDGIMKLSDFDALSFDCYGTLIDWEAGIAAVLRSWAREHGLALDDEALLLAYADQEARAELEHPAELYPDILARSMSATGGALGVPVSSDEARRLGVSVPDWPAFPDSHDALAGLGSRYQLIILSNVDRTSFAASNARLGVTFDAVVTAQDVGAYKPSHRNFDALLSKVAELGVKEGRLLHVAQSLFHDHVPAKEYGLATVWINRRHDRPGLGATPESAAVTPDWVFPSMAAFAEAAARDASG